MKWNEKDQINSAVLHSKLSLIFLLLFLLMSITLTPFMKGIAIRSPRFMLSPIVILEDDSSKSKSAPGFYEIPIGLHFRRNIYTFQKTAYSSFSDISENFLIRNF